MHETIDSLLKNGQISLNLGNPKEAMIFYDKVLAQDPQQIEALLKKGHILGTLARYQQAIIHYDNVLSQDRENLLALLNKGLSHHFIEEYDIAIKCYDRVLAVKPKNPTALYNKASSLVKSSRTKEGLKILSDLIKLDFSYNAKAKFDIDFEDIRKLNEFKEIIH